MSTSPKMLIPKKHVKAVQDNLKRIHCQICEASFSQAGSLKRHVQAIHEM
jgi:hypothetical protein